MNRSLSPIHFKKQIMDSSMGTEYNMNRSLSPIEFKKPIMDSAICTEYCMNRSLSPIHFKKQIMDNSMGTEYNINRSLSPIEVKKQIMDSSMGTEQMNQLLSPIDIEIKKQLMESTCTEYKIDQALSPIEIDKRIMNSGICTEKIRPKLTKRDMSITEVSDNMKRYQKVLQNTSTEPIQNLVENTNTQTEYQTHSIGILKKEMTNEDETQMTPAPTHEQLKSLKSFGTQQSHDRIKSENVADKALGTEDRFRPITLSHYTIVVEGSKDFQNCSADETQIHPNRFACLPYPFNNFCRCNATPVRYNKQTMKTYLLEKPKASSKQLAESRNKYSTHCIGTESLTNAQLAITYFDQEPEMMVDEITKPCGKKKSLDIGTQPDTRSHSNILADQSHTRLAGDLPQRYGNEVSNHKINQAREAAYEKCCENCHKSNVVADITQPYNKKNTLYETDSQPCEPQYKGFRNSQKSSQESKNTVVDVRQTRNKKPMHKTDSQTITLHSSKSYVLLTQDYQKNYVETGQSGKKFSRCLDTQPCQDGYKRSRNSHKLQSQESKTNLGNIRQPSNKKSTYEVVIKPGATQSTKSYLREHSRIYPKSQSHDSHQSYVESRGSSDPESIYMSTLSSRMRSSETYLLEKSLDSHKILIDTGQSCYKENGHDIQTQVFFDPIPRRRAAETSSTPSSFKMQLSPTRNRTSQSTLVESIYQPFIFEVGTNSSIHKQKSIGVVTLDLQTKTKQKSVVNLDHIPKIVSASTSTGLLTATKSTGGSAVGLKNFTLDAYAQYSNCKCVESTNSKDVQTDTEIKSAAVLTSTMHVDKATEPDSADVISTCDFCRNSLGSSFSNSNYNHVMRKSNQFQTSVHCTAAAVQCTQSPCIPLTQTPSTTGMVLKDNRLANLARLIAKSSPANSGYSHVASAPALFDVDDVEYSKWISRSNIHNMKVAEFPDSEEAKLAKLISRSCKKKSKSAFVRANRCTLKHDAPPPFEKLSKDSFSDVFADDIPETDMIPEKIAAESHEIAVYQMQPNMVDKETSDSESKDLKESILQTSPEYRDAETESRICNQRSAGVLTSQSLLPNSVFCYQYPEINPLDCLLVCDSPSDTIKNPCLNTSVQKFHRRDSAYKTLYKTTKLVKSMNIMTDDGTGAYGFISTGTSACAPKYQSSFENIPVPAEVIRTCSKNYHARILRLPTFFDQVPDEDHVKKNMFESCRYYSNLLTKQLARMKENLKHLKNAEECVFQDVSSVHCKADCTACTMIPSGRVELCCQTTKRQKLGTPLSRCVMAPSVTNIGDGHDKKHLKSIYYMLTAIEGRIRRLKHNIPD